jgi:hypothetical protein
MQKLKSLFVVAFWFASANVGAVTIDFEEYSGSVNSLDPILAGTDVGNGYVLSPGLGSPKWLNGAGPGSVTLALSTSATSIIIDRGDGLAFDLLAFDWDGGATGSYPLKISGTKSGGGVVDLTVDLEELVPAQWTNFTDTGLFQDITSLTIETVCQFGCPVGIVLDNFSVNTVVPVPAAAWLFGSAIGVMGAIRRRKPGI